MGIFSSINSATPASATLRHDAMDLSVFLHCFITFLMPLDMRPSGILPSLIIFVSTVLNNLSTYELLNNHSSIKPLLITRFVSVFAAYATDVIISGAISQFLLTYVFAFKVYFDVDDPLRVVPNFLGNLLVLPGAICPRIGAEIFASLQSSMPIIRGNFFLWLVEASSSRPQYGQTSIH